MKEYPDEVYAHLRDELNHKYRCKDEYDDPDYQLWRDYCVSEGLADFVDGYGTIGISHGLYYVVTAKGKVALRMRAKVQCDEQPTSPAEPIWSEYKPPSKWWKELGISGSTWRRYINAGKLIVDRSLSKKNVRIRLDTLRTMKDSK